MIKNLWYISFATPETFLGGTVVQADDAEDALVEASFRGLNPGGQAAIIEVPLEAYGKADMLAMRNRLVGRDEMIAMRGKRAADCSSEVRHAFADQATIVCAECNEP
jgi:hypothetical protein